MTHKEASAIFFFFFGKMENIIQEALIAGRTQQRTLTVTAPGDCWPHPLALGAMTDLP